MSCQFASIFSRFIRLTDKDQRDIDQASYSVSIRLILHSSCSPFDWNIQNKNSPEHNVTGRSHISFSKLHF